MKGKIKFKNRATIIIFIIQILLSLAILYQAINTSSFVLGIIALIISTINIEVK